jgi:hypothetical protein
MIWADGHSGRVNGAVASGSVETRLATGINPSFGSFLAGFFKPRFYPPGVPTSQ